MASPPAIARAGRSDPRRFRRIRARQGLSARLASLLAPDTYAGRNAVCARGQSKEVCRLRMLLNSFFTISVHQLFGNWTEGAAEIFGTEFGGGK